MTTTALALLLGIHLAATASMTGLIWFVQIVHYPLFSAIDRKDFVAYEAAHQRKTAWVVGPFMAVEGVSSLALAAFPGEHLGRALPLLGLVLLAIVHASTVFLQVPRHGQLSEGFDETVWRTLVSTNWIRTIGWSARSAVAMATIVVVIT